VGVVFDNCSFVNCANAIIFDEPGVLSVPAVQGNIGIVFDSMKESGTFTGPNWNAVRPAAFDTYGANIHFRGCGLPLYAGKYTVSGAFLNIVADYFDFELMDSLGTKPFANPFLNPNHDVEGNQLGSSLRGAGGFGGTVLLTGEAVSKGDLLEMTSYTQVRKCRFDGFSQVVGVAAHNAGNNEAVVVLNQANSPNLPVHNKTDNNVSPLSPSNIPEGSLLKPDPHNPGGVIPANDPSDEPIIGRVIKKGTFVNGVYVPQDIAPGASGQAQILI
jgi:hypothetical protein